jgi:hypothetical protein
MPPQLMRVALNSPHDHADRDHTHLHGHAPKNFGFAFAAGTLLNAGLVAAQFLYGIHAHSMALIADAGHNLGDALGLLIAWGAYLPARQPWMLRAVQAHPCQHDALDRRDDGLDAAHFPEARQQALIKAQKPGYRP